MEDQAQSNQTNIPTVPQVNSPEKKVSKKQGCFGCLGIIIILIVVGSFLGSNGNKSTNTAAPSTSSQKQEQPKEPEYKYTCDVQGIGKVKGAIVSDVGVAIAEIKSADSIDSQFTSTKAQGVFKILYVVASNHQKDAVTMDSASMKLIDDKGREYSHSTHGDTALQMKGRETFFLEQINPGNTAGGHIAFDVPKDANIVKMQFRGGMSGKKGELPFKIMPAE
ncbi:DUF4352 domain-containing protein [Sporomusa acidovorans]|nr:DUF4352 domain-containing protein [Sporomusa acidovorans]